MSTLAAISEPSLSRRAPSLATNARPLWLSQIVRRVLRLATFLVVARLLGVAGFGTYVLLLTSIEMVALVSGAGYVDYLTREIAKDPGVAWPLGVRVTQVRLFYIVPAAAIGMGMLRVLGFPFSLVSGAALLSISLIPRAVGDSAQGVLKGLQRFAAIPWIELFQGSIVLLAALVLLIRRWGISGVLVAEILGALGGSILAVCLLVPQLEFHSTRTKRFGEVLRRATVFNIYPLIANIYDRVDIVLLSRLAGSIATGIYALPYRAYAVLSVVPYGVMGALLPVFSASGDVKRVEQKCARAMQFLYVVALLLVLGTIAFAKPIVSLVLGQEYAPATATINILIWATVPMFLNYALNTFLLAAHREKIFLWTASICTAFNIGANLLLIPRYSYLAAASVTVVTEMLLLFQNVYVVRKSLRNLVTWMSGGRTTGAFLVALAGLLALRRFVPEMIAGSVACVIFTSLAIKISPGLFRFRPTEEQL